MAVRWSRLYFILGLRAAVLAAVAGATMLASTTGRVVAGVIALVASGLGAAAAFLDSETRRAQHANLAAAREVLGTGAEPHLALHLNTYGWVQGRGRTALQELQDRKRRLLEGKAPDAEAESVYRAKEAELRGTLLAQTIMADAESGGPRSPDG